jgi:large subunit ribosomal protein L9
MAAYIQVVLKDNLRHLGTSGEVVRVRPGFARNYLVPRGMAAYATKHNLARVEHEKREALARAAKLTAEAKTLAEKINGVNLVISRSVGAENRMYGSVTAKDIGDAFIAAGHTIDRRKIHLEAPIKALGTYELTLRLTSEVEATVNLEVVAESKLANPISRLGKSALCGVVCENNTPSQGVSVCKNGVCSLILACFLSLYAKPSTLATPV